MCARRFAFLLLCAAAVLQTPVRAQEAESISQAKAAASSWLALVDAGNYSASWQQAAGAFRSAVSPQSWAAAAQAARAPLGALQSRQVESATYTHTLPGAPEGVYVVIAYASRFANKAKAVETVTPRREKDGTWRVAGYFIR